MTLTPKMFFIGTPNIYLSSVPNSNFEESIVIFTYLDISNKSFLRYNSSLESFCFIDNVNDISFSNRQKLREYNYKIYGANYGNGIYFNYKFNKDFCIISKEDAVVKDAIFNIPHPLKKIIKAFSRKNEESSCQVCDYSDFDFKKYYSEPENKKFSVKLVGAMGHFHNSPSGQISLNGDSEVFLKKDFFIQDTKIISNLVEVLRKYHDKSDYQSNFKQASFIIRKGRKYFLYSEASCKGINHKVGKDLVPHNDRLGLIFELYPSLNGITSNKISLLSYIESLNYLKDFKDKSEDYNSEEFIPEMTNTLESFLK